MKMSETTGDGKKGTLPKGWRWVMLGDVCRIAKGRTPKESWYSKSGVHIVHFRDLTKAGIEWAPGFRSFVNLAYKTELRLLINGMVLLTSDAHDPLSIGKKICFIDHIPKAVGPVFYSGELMAVTTRDPNVMLPNWPFYWLSSASGYQEIQKRVHGVHLNAGPAKKISLPLPPLDEQKRIAAILNEQMAAVERARHAAQSRLEAAVALPAAFACESLRNGQKCRRLLADCLVEVKNGVGGDWSKYAVLGATRYGLAPAKDPVGKTPERYKLVDPVTVFYNPMRILLGSIAMVDEGDATGITSPDYVVVKGRSGILDTRWFYHWFRSAQGAHLIESLSRGAVRERILFNRLAAGELEIPDYKTQLQASERMKQVKPIIANVNKELETIDTMSSAILREVFTGAT